MMNIIKKVLGYLTVAIFCAGILAAAGYYVFDARFTNQSKAAGAKGGHAEKEGDSHDEGVKLTDAQVAAAGIELLKAGPHELRDILQLNGTVQPNQETLVKVTPRFPGVIRSMRKRLGDMVKKDDVLATVESNQSLTVYELKAPINGTVIDRDGTLGEARAQPSTVRNDCTRYGRLSIAGADRREIVDLGFDRCTAVANIDGNGVADPDLREILPEHREVDPHGRKVGNGARNRSEQWTVAPGPVRGRKGHPVSTASRCSRQYKRPSNT